LAAAGHKVVLAARNLDKLEQAAAEIRASGGDAHVAVIDLASPESIQEAIKKAIAEVGPIHILVNNAGVTKDGLSMRMKLEDFTSVIQTNLTGAFLCAQGVMPGMMKERWGRIINIASVVGEMGNPGQANYVASKAGLIGLTKSLAQELGSRGITVNAITPGFIETDMTAGLSAEVKEKMLNVIPLKRFGQSEDIAAAVAFLASESAGYITGHILKVNGGMYM
jgi:3-oxoacyl-[acyl-carrier protein] reductase